jgi:uncharacterized protein (TIGR03437 family)
MLLLLAAAAGPMQSQTLISLGATSGNSSGCSLSAGATCTLSALVTGITPATATFEFSPTVAGATVGTPSGPSSSGLTTITYKAPSPVAARQTVTVVARAADGTPSSPVTITLVPVSISVQISPATVTLTSGQTQHFTATVFGVSQSGVTWSYTPQVGTFASNGNNADFTAPGGISTAQKVTITATSTFDTTVSGTATVTLNPLISVGAGAPTDAMISAFQGAWNRNGFNALVSMPPVANVRAFGNSGYVQEFLDANNSSLKHALVTGAASIGGTNIVFQILGPLYAYYTSVGANTAGYPLGDSQTCSAQNVTCVWDTFDKSYALFSYTSTLDSGQNFSLNGTFYTEWTAAGGIPVLGSPVTAQTTNVTAAIIAPATTATTATVQTFARGAIYSITNNANRGKIFTVAGAIYGLYVAQSGPFGQLGMPTSELYQIATGIYRQNFEGGVLQSGTGDPTILLPVASVTLSGAPTGSTIALNLGDKVSLTATPMLTSGEVGTDRPVSWSSTNGKVLSIQANGGTAVVTAVGAGSASVQAASQGVSSVRVNFVVTSRCCQLGDGAPTQVQQAFQDAVTRSKITLQTPLPSPAERVGSGYVQMVPSADGKTTYLIAIADQLGSAYVVTGAVLARYQALGGPAGALGYPAGDASAGGTQLFANGVALAGSPVRMVSNPILAKWTLLGYETGAAGFPTGDAAAFSTFGANSGQQQAFSKGVIFAASSGPRAGQAYFVTGAILAGYNAVGGVSGDFGMPSSDEFVTGTLHQQNFEGGNLTYATGDATAAAHPAARAPGVVMSPASVFAGGRARIAVLGFPNNSALRISVSGAADFSVTAATGAYSWDMAIPLGASSGTVTIRAVDANGASANGTLTIKGFADNRVQLTKVQGDSQTGLPGALLPLALRVALMDTAGSPISGAPVNFSASAGVQLSATSVVTDGNGRAEVVARLAGQGGIGLVNASSPSIAQAPVTFSMRAAANTLENVPKLVQAGETPLGNGTATIAKKGALLTAVASILRYHQNRGELRAPNGLSDAATLNEFLKQDCTVDTRGAQTCDGFLPAGASAEQVVNLWRAAEFTGGVDVAVRTAGTAAIVDALASGSPALLSLAISRNGAAAGGHFVVAVGVADDGSILIQDPNPALARSNLNDYLQGFAAAGATWSGTVRGVVLLALRNPPASRFLLGAVSQAPDLIGSMALEAQSVSGTCGVALDLIDSVDGVGTPSGGLVSRLRACDGTDALYQVAVGASRPYRAFLTDLATAGSTIDLSGSSPATYRATRSLLNLVLAPQSASFTADGVVNGANFGPGLAPGGLMSIFGTGLSGTGTATAVDVDGVSAEVVSSSPFQVNAVVPGTVGAGTRTVQVRSAYGTAQHSVAVSDVAPAIFLIGSPPVGAVFNQDWTLNTSTLPVSRGQTLIIYATGLGSVAARNGIPVTTATVTAMVNGVELPVAFAGQVYSGVYQVNLAIPAAIPPGLGTTLALKVGGQVSNTVPISVQ